MVFDKTDVVIDRTINNISLREMSKYLAHVICEEGELEFLFNSKPFVLRKGETMIIMDNSFIEIKNESSDLKIICVYTSKTFVEVARPKNNYGIFGALSLFVNPIMHPDSKMYKRLLQDFYDIEERLNSNHNFLDDTMMCYTQAMFLDYFHIHSLENKYQSISEQSSSIMGRFIALLESGNYVKHRELTYYADKLFVTSKHLSELCKQISGFSANYWINTFTTIHIRRLLKDRKMSFTEISDMFSFSSPAYFNRFVQRNLGATPSEFRK